MSISVKDVKSAIKDPKAEYETPEMVINDDHLTVNEKHEILISWKEDVKALMRAEAENMQSDQQGESPEVLLRRINALISYLKN